MQQFGKYSLIKKIGQGGMAEIWQASLRGVRGFEKPLVIKRILPKYAQSRRFVEFFIQEAKITSGLQHPNIVQIFELGEIDGTYFIAMEYVKGWDLLRLLYQSAIIHEPIPEPIALYIVQEMCRGLQYAHQAIGIDGDPLNIVHLDVSPSNVLLDIQGSVKVTDFGVARANLEGGAPKISTRRRGKVAYMSPEQIAGAKVDGRSDIFAVGIVMYELLTLRRLFRGRTPEESLEKIRACEIEPMLKKSEISFGVRDILRKAVAKERVDRYQSAADLEEAIQQHLFTTEALVTRRDFTRWLAERFSGVDIHDHTNATVGTHTFAAARSTRATSALKGLSGVGSAPEAVREALKVAAKRKYTFRKTSGSAFGPVALKDALELIKEGCVAPDELVSVDGTDWQEARKLPQLSDALARTYPPETAEPLVSGSFDRFDIVRMLAEHATARSTGRLKLQRAEVRKEIYFSRGRIVHVVSNRKDELLGMYLQQKQAVTMVQLQLAFDNVQTWQGPIGEELVKLGFIGGAALFQLLGEHAFDQITELLEWR